MLKKNLLLHALCGCLFAVMGASVALEAQTPAVSTFANYKLPDPTTYANTILASDLKILVDTLASNTMAGRETGEEGQRLAADFIGSQFQAIGLPAVGDRRSYQQKIYLQRTLWSDLAVKVEDTEYKNREDFYVFHAANADMPMLKVKEAVFVGYGIQEGAYNDYSGADVHGKVVVFYNGEPLKQDGTTFFTGSANRSAWSMDWKRKLKIAKEQGAVMAVIIDPNFKDNLRINRRQISTYGWKTVGTDSVGQDAGLINSVFVTPELAAAIFGKKAEKVAEMLSGVSNGVAMKPLKFKTNLEVRMVKEITKMEGSNVIGFIEGSDPVLKNEYVLVTAHYDHLGVHDNQIFYGADDNASGTAGVIEIARAFAEARKNGVGPKRSVVCMLVSGEEKGLLGSRFYTDFPVFSLKQTVVDINIDMIGRVDKAHITDPNYIYVIGSDRLSTELYESVERMNSRYTQLKLDYKYNDPSDPNHYYERSDHYNFAEKGIPVVFFFNGTHDDYHRATDTRDKINFDAQAKRAQLAFLVAWDAANRPERLRVDKPAKKGNEAPKGEE